MKTKLSGIRPSPCQLYIQWIRKDWSKTSLSLVIVLPDLTWRPLFTRCCKDLNCVQISVASLRIIAGLLSWNVQLLPASTLHRNSLSSPYLYSPHDISEKKSRPFTKLIHPFPWQRSRVSTHSALLALAWIFPFSSPCHTRWLCSYTRWCYVSSGGGAFSVLNNRKAWTWRHAETRFRFFLLNLRRIVIKEGNGRNLETRE